VRALAPCSRRIRGCERSGPLPVSHGLDRHAVELQPHGELARRSFGPGAHLADRAGATGRGMETDPHDGIPRGIPAWSPSDAGLPLGTARLVGLPIQHESAEVITATRPTLVARGPKGWPDHVDLMGRLRGDQAFGIHIAAVEQVHAGKEIARGQVILDARAHDTIRCGRWRGHDASQEVRLTGSGLIAC
jgi:hypothetical protein